MAERRASWPWRKKSMPKLDKIAFSPSQSESPATSSKYDALPLNGPNGRQETAMPIIVEDTRLTEAVQLREQAEANVNILKEELSNALKDAASKEAMSKHHEKVMEDAVSGWEKAEKEALSYKQELEAASKQKTILEDRVAHLDGALKECMKQVRHVKEEQEKRIEETIMSKTREWEKIKAEVDSKQVELERRLMESEAQNNAMAKSLQERAKKILEANESKEKAETHAKVLQVKLGSAEKEIAAMKYELHVLYKELEIRNEEAECNKKAADAAHKQHLENVKKVAKLEADCQRLKNLVRKKLPGPAAIAQMRREVEGPSSRESVASDLKRRPARFLTNGSMSISSSYQSDISTGSRDVELLKDRMSSMEEETKLLKEALSKKNEAREASGMLCAKTANKLSVAEDHLESLQATPKEKNMNDFDTDTNPEPSGASASKEETNLSTVEEASCAESWASALMSELALFKKGKSTSKDASKELMESSDILESSVSMEEAADKEMDVVQADDGAKEALYVSVAESKLQELDLVCKELGGKFIFLEEQLRSLKSENGVHDRQVEDDLMSRLEETNQKFSCLERVIQEMGGRCQPSSVPGSSPPTKISDDSVFGNCSPVPVSSIRVVLSKLIVVLETLLSQHKQSSEIAPTTDPDSPSKLENGISNEGTSWIDQKQLLIASKDSFLAGKSTISEFLIQLGIVLCKACDTETADLEDLLRSVNGQLFDVSPDGFLNELSLAQDQLQQVTDAKAEVEMQMASVSEELGTINTELVRSKELVIDLQSKVTGMQGSENKLVEVEALKVELERKLEASEGEISKLHASVVALTLELAEEKKAHEGVLAKCAELENKLQSWSVYDDESNGLKPPDDEDTRLGKERELVGAKEKLAECQRTILALGKQLSALSSPPTELSPGGSFDTVSMDSASLLIDPRMPMELQNGGSSMEHHASNGHHQSFYQMHHTKELTSPMPTPGQYNPNVSSRRMANAGSAGGMHGTPPALQPAPQSAGWSRGRPRACTEEMKEPPRSWPAQYSNGSFSTKKSRHRNAAGADSEAEHPHHHHNYQQPGHRRPAHVSPTCQYSQRPHYDGPGSMWATPGYLPEEDEHCHELGLTVYSPSAMSSPARSPARYAQQLGGGRAPSRTAMRTSLAVSMNAASATSDADFSPTINSKNNGADFKGASKPSAIGKLFSRSKNHR